MGPAHWIFTTKLWDRNHLNFIDEKWGSEHILKLLQVTKQKGPKSGLDQAYLTPKPVLSAQSCPSVCARSRGLCA